MSLKRVFVHSVLAVFLLVGTAQAQVKVGSVNVDRVCKEYRKTKDSQAKLSDAKNAAQKEFGERADAYNAALDEIKKLDKQLEAPALSAQAKADKARERDAKIADIKNMEGEITEFRQTREQELQEQAQQLRADIIEDVMNVVLAEVQKRHFDLVFDTSGTSLSHFSPILYSPASDDFTAAVIADLNKSQAASAATPKPSPAK